jgi:predicted RNA methylase
MLQKSIRRVGRAWQRYGVWKLFLISVNLIPSLYRDRRAASIREKRQREFDLKYGVDTGGITDLSVFSIKHPTWVWGTRYGPSSEAFVVGVLRTLKLDYRSFAFVDYGSGKGAVLLYASNFPFREIIGVEFSSELHDIASTNLQHFSRVATLASSQIRSVCADATTFDVPLVPLVLYFLAPFGPPVLRAVLARIESSFRLAPREVYIIFGYPSYIWNSDAILAAQSFLTKVQDGVVEGIPYVIYRAAPFSTALN